MTQTLISHTFTSEPSKHIFRKGFKRWGHDAPIEQAVSEPRHVTVYHVFLSYILTLGWQKPYSVQHSDHAGHPSAWSISSEAALKGGAGQDPAPTPAPRQPPDTRGSRDNKETRENRDNKDTRDNRDNRDTCNRDELSATL